MRKLPGFTLVELLVVMAIVGVLVTLVAGGFRISQMRGRDAQRKSDLKQLASALELYLSDHGAYPESSGGLIMACPSTTTSPCSWGSSEMSDGKTIYFKVMPKDPVNSLAYFYRQVPASGGQKFQLFARLENPNDQDCLAGDCSSSPVTYSCGSEVCNFSVTSSNTSPTE